MSIYNSANELAWRVVYDEHYFTEPNCQCGQCGRPSGIAVVDGKLIGVLDEDFYGESVRIDLTGKLAEDHKTWADLAQDLQG